MPLNAPTIPLNERKTRLTEPPTKQTRLRKTPKRRPISSLSPFSSPARGWTAFLAGTILSCLPTAPRASASDSTPSSRSWPSFLEAGPFQAGPRSEPTRVALDVPGFLPAVLVVPAGTQSRPLVVAAHGAGGAPEWDCEYWSRLLADRAFVLCPRGTAMGPGSYYFKHHYALGAEVAAATTEARRQFPRILPSSGVYAGFSQGASMGALMIPGHADQFPYVVLIEGFTQWNIPLGRAFAKRGGRALLFVCGTRACATKAEASTQALQQTTVRARSEHAVGAGHTASGAVMERVVRQLPWLLANDPAWAR
jgi:predicted esterase